MPVSLDRVVDLLHVTNAPELVEQYRAAMLTGDRFPPVSVVRLFGILFLADGHKRFTAYAALGAPYILVEVWPKRRWLADQASQLRTTVRRVSASMRGQGEAPTQIATTELHHLLRIARSLMRRPRRE